MKPTAAILALALLVPAADAAANDIPDVPELCDVISGVVDAFGLSKGGYGCPVYPRPDEQIPPVVPRPPVRQVPVGPRQPCVQGRVCQQER